MTGTDENAYQAVAGEKDWDAATWGRKNRHKLQDGSDNRQFWRTEALGLFGTECWLMAGSKRTEWFR